jgi:hypothetical protein
MRYNSYSLKNILRVTKTEDLCSLEKFPNFLYTKQENFAVHGKLHRDDKTLRHTVLTFSFPVYLP